MSLIALWPFVSSWMLLWGLAAVAPLLIHLWSRRKYHEVSWAAMEYLLAAIRKHSRRLRLEQWLLLVIRTFILLLLAVALADPVWSLIQSFGAPPVEPGTTHLVLVLDGTYSMDYRQADASRFDLAKGIASQLVRESTQGDGFTLIVMGDPPRSVIEQPAFDPTDVIDEVAGTRLTDGGANLVACLAEVERVVDLAKQRQPRLTQHRIYFLTDLGRTTWGTAASSSTRDIVIRLAEKAELQLIDVGQTGGQNIAVTRLAAAQHVVTVAEPVRLEAELHNLGSQDRTQHKVEFLVDGQVVLEEEADVPAGEHTTVTVSHEFLVPGEHVVEVRSGTDRLEVDNQRWLSLPVREAVRVLCVEGSLGAARFVAMALNPGRSSTSRIQPVVQPESALLETELSQYDCVFLCNIGRFGRDEAGVLRNYLRRGGAIVFFLGDQVQPDSYNEVLGIDAGQDSILPGRLGAAVPTGDYFYDPIQYRHPIVEPFRGNERAGLLTTPIWKYIPVDVSVEPNANVALAFNTGDPAIAELIVGAGKVILWTTAASDASVDLTTNPPTPWSAQCAWPSFPPLVQRILDAATSRRERQRNRMVGDPIESCDLSTKVPSSSVVVNPDGERQRVTVSPDTNSGWLYTDTDRRGLYTVQLNGSSDDLQLFCVNIDTIESQLDRLELEALPSQFLSRGELAAANEPQADSGRLTQLFRHVFLAVLVLLLSESALAWFFGRATM